MANYLGANGGDGTSGVSNSNVPGADGGDGTQGVDGQAIGLNFAQADVDPAGLLLNESLSAGKGGNGGNAGGGGAATFDVVIVDPPHAVKDVSVTSVGSAGFAGQGGKAGAAVAAANNLTAHSVALFANGGAGGAGGNGATGGGVSDGNGFTHVETYNFNNSNGSSSTYNFYGASPGNSTSGANGGYGGRAALDVSQDTIGDVVGGGTFQLHAKGGAGGNAGGGANAAGGLQPGMAPMGGDAGLGGEAVLNATHNDLLGVDAVDLQAIGGDGGNGGNGGSGGKSHQLMSTASNTAVLAYDESYSYSSGALGGHGGTGGNADIVFEDNTVTTKHDFTLSIDLESGRSGVAGAGGYRGDGTSPSSYGGDGEDGTTALLFSGNTFTGNGGTFHLILSNIYGGNKASLFDEDFHNYQPLGPVYIDLNEGLFEIGNDVSSINGFNNVSVSLTDGYFDVFGKWVSHAQPVTVIGAGGANTIIGNSGNDSLDGGGGADQMRGGAGDDNYYVDNTGDVVVENSNEGTDTIYSTVTYTLPANVENLVLQGSVNIDGTGNDLDNYIQGNSGDNVLEGMGGNDGLWAGAGNDTASYDHALFAVAVDLALKDQWQNTFGAGNDYLDSIENLVGSAFGDILKGDNNINTLTGLDGDDSYYVQNTGDVVVEQATQGTDSVYSTATYTLSANVENLVLLGSANIDGTGNGLDNYIQGNTGNNVLEGGAGNDGLWAGAGNDTASYEHAQFAVAVDLALQDQWQNTFGAGNDYLDSIENLTGSAFGDILKGDNTINTLTGLDGDDSYYVQNSGDVVVELANQGTDSVYSTATYALSANIENLVLQGSANIDGTGNELDNYIQGNGGNNVLEGLGGNDGLWGGLGTDTASYAHSAFAVAVDLGLQDQWQNTFGAGNDYLDSIENLTGSVFGDILKGDNNVNTLTGLAGDDSYYVQNTSDIVVEQSDQGTDTVYSTVNYTLSANVENLILQGAAIIGTGNAGDNYIQGNSGINLLEGGAGNDTLFGGDGIDTASYATATSSVKVDLSLHDQWQNTFGAGNDYFDSIENVLGSNYDDILIGDSGANMFTGGLGNDLMTGAGGADIFWFNGEPGQMGVDWITDFTHGEDKLQFPAIHYGVAPGDTLPANELTVGTSAVGAHGQFIYNPGEHMLYWDADGTGATAAVKIVGLDHIDSLDVTDFGFR